jgi:hypothetical protein
MNNWDMSNWEHHSVCVCVGGGGGVVCGKEQVALSHLAKLSICVLLALTDLWNWHFYNWIGNWFQLHLNLFTCCEFQLTFIGGLFAMLPGY